MWFLQQNAIQLKVESKQSVLESIFLFNTAESSKKVYRESKLKFLYVFFVKSPVVNISQLFLPSYESLVIGLRQLHRNGNFSGILTLIKTNFVLTFSLVEFFSYIQFCSYLLETDTDIFFYSSSMLSNTSAVVITRSISLLGCSFLHLFPLIIVIIREV